MTHAMLNLRRPAFALIALVALASCRTEIAIPKDPPEARKDYARTALNTPVTLAPLANDYDPNSELLSVVTIGAASHGTAVLNPSGTVTYTPNGGYLGGDQFTVTITDASGHEVTDSAYVAVGPSVRMIYQSNFVDYFTFQLYMSDALFPGVAIPVSGHIPVTVGPTRPSATIDNFNVSANGLSAGYLLDEPDSPRINLYHVDMATPGVAVQLTTMASGQAIRNEPPQLSADGLYVYYESNEFNPDAFEIVRVEVANPANKVRMNPALPSSVVSGATVWDSLTFFSLSADGNQLLYVRFNRNASGPGVGAAELYVVDTATPGVATKLSGVPTAASGGVVSLGITPKFVPGTTKAVYPAVEGGSTTLDLYLVDYIAHSVPVKLSGTAVLGGVGSYFFSSDSTRVVYTSSEDSGTVLDLYTVLLALPGASTRLSKLRAVAGSIKNYVIGPDDSYVVYVRDDDTTDIDELYKVDFATPTIRTKLNHVLRAGATGVPAEEVLAAFVTVSVGSPRAVLYSTNDVAIKNYTRQTIRRVSVDVPGVTTTVGTPTGANYYFLWAPDGDTVMAADDPDLQNVISSYLTSVSGPATMTKLTPEIYGGASVRFTLTPWLP